MRVVIRRVLSGEYGTHRQVARSDRRLNTRSTVPTIGVEFGIINQDS